MDQLKALLGTASAELEFPVKIESGMCDNGSRCTEVTICDGQTDGSYGDETVTTRVRYNQNVRCACAKCGSTYPFRPNRGRAYIRHTPGGGEAPLLNHTQPADVSISHEEKDQEPGQMCKYDVKMTNMSPILSRGTLQNGDCKQSSPIKKNCVKTVVNDNNSLSQKTYQKGRLKEKNYTANKTRIKSDSKQRKDTCDKSEPKSNNPGKTKETKKLVKQNGQFADKQQEQLCRQQRQASSIMLNYNKMNMRHI